MSERQSLGSSCEVDFEPSWAGERHGFGVAENLGRTWCSGSVSVEEGGRWVKQWSLRRFGGGTLDWR